nr:hypothetical protein [Gemmatimonadaceae bacterium]
MNETAIIAACGALLVVASAAFFFLGQRYGVGAEKKRHIEARTTAEETSR